MKLGTARATLDVDVRHRQMATGGTAGLGHRDPARVLAATIVARIEERDALRGRRVGRVADHIRGAREIDGEHRRPGVEIADELAFVDHAGGVVQQLDGDRREPNRNLAFEQRDAASDRHRFERWRLGSGHANTTTGEGHARKSYGPGDAITNFWVKAR
ncbi:MAG TPA: hypothetical protein VGL61_04720 [Kofleriaceae bacterium]